MEEKTAEVVRNHEGGSRMGTGVLIPKGGRDGAGTLRIGHPGDGLRGFRTTEGRSLDNPKRGNPASRLGRKDRNASEDGAKVRRVAHTNTYVKVRGPVDGPRRPASTRKARS
jgi:hypothetical protein